MSLSRDEIYRLIAVAKGDIPASAKHRQVAMKKYCDLLEQWTRQLQRAEPGELSITRESVRNTVEEAYEAYRRRADQAARRRLLG